MKQDNQDPAAGGDPKTATPVPANMGELRERMRTYLHTKATNQERLGAVRNGLLSIEQLLVKYGKEWVPAALPPGVERGRPNLCFTNASHLALDQTGLTYVEGYGFNYDVVLSLDLEILHAWCVDSAGRVVDSTWNEPGKCYYFGIPFKTSFLRFFLLQKRRYGLLDSPEAPIQRGIWPVKKWLSSS
jgi:hypothetical protein